MLDRFRAEPRTAGVFCDFDGTLAPIVDDPSLALPISGAVDALSRLSSRYAVVGIISGRPGAFLADHFGGLGLSLSGLYGMETVTDGRVVSHPASEAWRAVVEDTVSRAETEAEALPGVGVEHKGLSLTLHYRSAPEAGPAARSWAEEASRRTGLVVHAARMSYELRPPIPCTKGTVLAGSAAGLEAVCFVGDDHADIEAFEVLDSLAADGTHCLRVAVASREAPAELVARADLVVEGPAGVLDLLHRL